MIDIPNKDRFIFDLPLRVVDIIKEYQDTGKLSINTNAEGICLNAAKFYPVLDYICDKFSIDKSQVKIVTNNIEEYHPVYKILPQHDHWIINCKPIFNYALNAKNQNLKHLGCFMGKANWHRLIMGSWLHTNHKDKTLLTLHYNPQFEKHRIDCGVNDVNFFAPVELGAVVEFMKNCPVTLDEGFINPTIGPPTNYNIIHQYENIFADLVVETYVSGASFFPTEKTLRPIIAKTPFIVMGPAGYLSNLKRMGFKTFDNWWDEGYDDYSDYDRLCQIKTLLENIFKLTDYELHSMLIDMRETLEYNRNHLQKIDSFSVKLDEQK